MEENTPTQTLQLNIQTPNPNPDQQKALDAFFEFMLSSDTEYHLTGGAGVGKTFTLDLIMNEGMDRYEEACKLLGIEQTIFSIALTATTNKAADVLTNATGKVATTIHSYMGFKVREDYKTGETKISVTNNTTVIQNTLIIIDEASMIDFKLYSLLKKYTHNCKFLYVGDHCQMAPVKEKLSKIYDNKKFFSNLTVPVRNANQPALMALCDQLRATVETGVFKPIHEVPGVIEYLSGPQMEALVASTFKVADPNARILCYRNSQVKAFNYHIRQLRGLPEYYIEGETLVCANAFQTTDNKLSIEQEIEVVANPQNQFTKKVQDVEFDVYELKIKPKHGNKVFSVMIPVDEQHFKSLVKWFASKKNWSGYFHMQQCYPDLRPKDACTVYKAQGSTYETVFVDLEDISTCTHADQVARMLYVAGSRPTTKLYLYGRLKPAYCGG